jgi:hypothetical protein
MRHFKLVVLVDKLLYNIGDTFTEIESELA